MADSLLSLYALGFADVFGIGMERRLFSLLGNQRDSDRRGEAPGPGKIPNSRAC